MSIKKAPILGNTVPPAKGREVPQPRVQSTNNRKHTILERNKHQTFTRLIETEAQYQREIESNESSARITPK